MPTGWDSYGEEEADLSMGNPLFGGKTWGPGKITAPSGLRLRSAPSTSSTSIVVMPAGAVVDVTDFEAAPADAAAPKGWAEVEYNGQSGYASAEWIAPDWLDAAAPSVPVAAPKPAAPAPAPAPTAAAPKSNAAKIGIGAAVALALAYYFS